MRISKAFGLTATLLLSSCAALPVRRQARMEPIAVEEPVEHPAAVLECLKRHRYTPRACNFSGNAFASSPPPPPPASCEIGNVGEICHYGSGQCDYDATRGYFCRCTAKKAEARGMPAQRKADAAPDCIDT